jgi:maltooligosyltrehalose trehalohydrolase
VIVSVWAPRAQRAVDVVLDGGGRRVALAPGERGRWAGEVPDLGPGGDYAFSLDGGAPRPDPRSAHQPFGVHGPSRVVDHGAFAWSDAGWDGTDLSAAVLYEVHVGTFSASTPSSFCPSPSSRAGGAGATTASTCGPRTTPTAAPTA